MLLNKTKSKIIKGLYPGFWLSLFVGIEIIRNIYLNFNFGLDSLSDIGIATFEEVNVGARINFYYATACLLAVYLFLSKFLFSLIYTKQTGSSYFLNLTDKVGFWAVLSQFTLLWTSENIPILFLFKLLIVFVLSLWIGSIFKIINNKIPIEKLLFVCLSFIGILMFLRFAGTLPGLTSSYKIIPSISVLLSLGWILLMEWKNEFKNKLNYLFKYIIPLLPFLPFAVILSFEGSIWIKHHGYTLAPEILPFLFLIFIAMMMLRRSNRQFYLTSVSIAIPSLLFIGLAANFKAYYPYSGEMFEFANMATPLMRFYEYGEWPLVSAFSSHLFNDWVWPFIHSLFYGYDNTLDFMVFYQFQHVVRLLIFYWIASLLFKNKMLALGFVLFFPFEWIASYRYIMPLIGVGTLLFLLQKITYFRIHLFLFVCFSLLLWSMEVGIAHSLAMLICLPFILSQEKFRAHIPKVLIGLVVQLLAWLLVWLLVCYVNNVSPLEPLRKIILYAGAAQAHGFERISATNDRFFALHYILYPILATFSLFWLWLNRKKYHKQHIAGLYITVFAFSFYVANFQRGLVRHSLFSGHDVMTTSLLYLGIFGMILLIFSRKSTVSFGLLAKSSIVLTVLIFLGKVGAFSNQALPLAASMSNGLEYLKNPIPAQKIARTELKEKLPHKLIYLLKNQLQKEETFLDFSNNPMLYYFTQKQVPGYFNQNLQNLPLPKQQEMHLKELADYDIPLVIYSKLPPSWWDMTDGIPNTLRYHDISNHIHKHYEPWGEIDGFWIWRRKGYSNTNLEAYIHTVEIPFINQDLKNYPALLANHILKDKAPDNESLIIQILNPEKATHKLTLQVFNFNKHLASIVFRTKITQSEYAFPLTLNYPFYRIGFDKLKVMDEAGNPVEFKILTH